ncbi:hypothetical protein FNH13_08900 [Ornithinimicrobium ciconiae]|uniref:Uncharacterized protein n=1 Tax=Ornithinimicrobium ciconiae TaxID=2594265 RepID=A0A516GA95_9MICO|nr:hypothetical protein [Ornithinimicrobium ciconiae]QDO88443.1 hypothetical protein FNH13_08900 [Ornithinimicrobium ciconiae]
MSDTTPDGHQEPDEATSGRDDSGQIPSADQDVASGQPYDPRQDPETDANLSQEKAPAQEGVNQRDPAEGPDDESATDG